MDCYDTCTWFVNRAWTQQMSVKGKLVATEILWNILCWVNIDARKWREGNYKEKENGYTISHYWIVEMQCYFQDNTTLNINLCNFKELI